MATKAELEEEARRYEILLLQARAALQSGNIPHSIQISVQSWPYIDGMMQYERKYNQREFKSVETIELVLKYAPIIFDTQSLETLEELLKSKKRIDKFASADLADKLATANQQLHSVLGVWSHLEQNTGFRQDELRRTIGGDQEWWRWVAEIWESQGYLTREPVANSYRLTLNVNYEEKVFGKCPCCGVKASSKKYHFWKEVACPKCKAAVYFVICNSQATAI